MSQQYQRVFNAKTISGLMPGASDVQVFNSDIVPSTDLVYDVGTPSKRWQDVYTNNVIASNNVNVGESLSARNATINGDLQVDDNTTLNTATVDQLTVTSNLSVPNLTVDNATFQDLTVTDTASFQNITVADTVTAAEGDLDYLVVGDITDTTITDFDDTAVAANRKIVTPRLQATSYIVSPLISTMGFTQVDKFYASRATDTTSKTDSNAAVKVDGGVAVAKRVWADAFQADTEVRTASLVDTGNATVSGTLSAGATSVTSVTTSGNAVVGGTLGVTGASSLSTLSTSGAANLNSLSVAGTSTLTGNTTIGGTLAVSGGQTFSATTNMNIGLTSGNFTVGGNLNVTSLSNLSSLSTSLGATIGTTLGVTGNTTLGGTLGVTGATSLSTLSSSGAATLNSLAVTNGATVGTTLGVTGATSLSTLSTSGAATINSLTVTNSASAATLSAPLVRASGSNGRFVGRCTGTTYGNVHLGSITVGPYEDSNNIVIEAGTLSDGSNEGLSAINFNGYFSSSDRRIDTSRYRWRLLCSQPFGNTAVDDIRIDVFNGSIVTTPFIVTKAFNIGLNTGAPQAPIHAYGKLRVGGSAAPYTLELGEDTNTQMYRDGSNNLVLKTGGTARMQINSGGSVGINAGLATPVGTLHLGSGNTNNNIVFEAGALADGSNAGMSCINFNGYFSGGEQRINTSKNRWRMYVDHRGAADKFAFDIWNGTTLVTALEIGATGSTAFKAPVDFGGNLVTMGGLVSMSGATATGLSIVHGSGIQTQLRQDGHTRFAGYVIPKTGTPFDTASNSTQTYTTSQVTSLIIRSPTSPVTDNFPTYASLISAGYANGDVIPVYILNRGSATLTLAWPSGGSAVGNTTVTAGTCKIFHLYLAANAVNSLQIGF